jgi:plasmid stabilization system protein ParE
MRIRNTSAVDQEIVEAVAYYLNEHSPQSAERFDNLLKSTIEEISENPFLCPILDENVRVKFLSPFPFSIPYSIEEAEIVIVALAHQKRKAGYWKKRL